MNGPDGYGKTGQRLTPALGYIQARILVRRARIKASKLWVIKGVCSAHQREKRKKKKAREAHNCLRALVNGTEDHNFANKF